MHPSFPSRLRLTMLSTRGRGDSRKTNKGGPSFPANQATKKAQIAPRHGSRHHTRQISPSEPLENWYKDQLLDKLEELNPVKSRQLQRAKVNTIIRAIHNLGFDPESRHALSESNTQQQQQQHPQQQLQLASQQQQQLNECGTLDQDKSDSDDVVEEVICDRSRGRARKRVHVTEDEEDLEAHIERTVKRLVPDIIQAVLSSQSQPAALTVSNNSDVSATSWSGTIQAAGPAQTQLGNQSIASNSLSHESDRSNGLSVIAMQEFFGQTGQLNPQSAPPVGAASTAPFLTRNSFASLPGDRLADNVDGQVRGAVPISSADSLASRQLLCPLLVHRVPESAKKKAWAGQLVPLYMFLPGYSDHDSSPSLVPTQQEDGTFVFVSNTSEREKRLSKRALTPAEFVNAFTRYKEVILECFPKRARELDAYLLHIIELANSYTGRAYWQYHTAFAKKAANLWAHGVRLDWAVVDPILLHQAIASERAHSVTIAKKRYTAPLLAPSTLHDQHGNGEN